MSKLLPRLAALAAIVVAVLALGALAVYAASNRRLSARYTVQPSPVTIPTDAAALERGKHLAQTRGCMDCHGADLGGAKVIEDGKMGVVYGPNITRGAGGVVAAYQENDYVRAIRHGVSADGHALFIMPSEDYALLSNEDLGALIAYLKSAPPVDRASVPVKVGPLARALLLAGKMPIAAERIDHARVQPPTATPGVTPEYGRYIAAATCAGCHNPSFSGGKIDVGPPDWPPSANLTPDASGRLAKWSEADFIAALRTGRRPDGSEINPIMPRNFGKMDDVELKALWAYLKTVPAKPTGQR